MFIPLPTVNFGWKRLSATFNCPVVLIPIVVPSTDTDKPSAPELNPFLSSNFAVILLLLSMFIPLPTVNFGWKTLSTTFNCPFWVSIPIVVPSTDTTKALLSKPNPFLVPSFTTPKPPVLAGEIFNVPSSPISKP